MCQGVEYQNLQFKSLQKNPRTVKNEGDNEMTAFFGIRQYYDTNNTKKTHNMNETNDTNLKKV